MRPRRTPRSFSHLLLSEIEEATLPDALLLCRPVLSRLVARADFARIEAAVAAIRGMAELSRPAGTACVGRGSEVIVVMVLMLKSLCSLKSILLFYSNQPV